MPNTRIINGVDTGKLAGTIDAIKADPTLATFQFRLLNRWLDGGENHSRLDDYHGANQELRHEPAFELVNDEPPVLLSGDKAPNPVEYVLHALAGCLTTTLIYHAAARGIEVKGVSTRFEGDLDLHGFLGLSDKVRRGFRAIRVVFDIKGDFDEATKKELIALAKAHSPVFDIVTNGVKVQSALEGNGASKKAA
jgi:uncharacterized OsmC-like protein